MDTAFIRNQMIAKLKEFEFYNNLYQEAIQKEKDKLLAIHTQEELDEFIEVTQELKDFNDTTNEIIQDIDIIVTRLCVSHKNIMERLGKVVQEHKDENTTGFDGVIITREKLQYSTFAKSAGFNKEKGLMDIEFVNGNVYRYENVPNDFFEKIHSRNSLKGVNVELGKFLSKKIFPLS